MKIGLQVPNFSFKGGKQTFSEDIKNIALQAEEAGFYSFWVMDHFFQIGSEENLLLGSAEDDMYEGYSILNHVAAVTKTIKLGTLVTGNIYRHPGVLVKTATTLDILSNGRTYLGIGAGWFEREAVGLGIPFYDWTTRFEMLEEALKITKLMWSDKNGEEFKGKHYHLKETMCHPLPIQRYPHIMIGGMGHKKTLKFVAKYADACNLFLGRGLEPLQEALRVLERHCEEIGRPYVDVEKTVLISSFLDQPNIADTNSAGLKNLKTSRDIIAIFEKLSHMGITHIIFNMQNPLAETKPLQIFKEEIIPAAKDFAYI